MRLDLFLKWSRIIPRRTLARATCDAGRVKVNGEVARAARPVRVDDVIAVQFPARQLRFRVRSFPASAPGKIAAGEMVEILENRPTEDPSR